MTARDRLTECGFRLAEVPFRITDRVFWFAVRTDPDSGRKHWFAIDFDNGTVDRWTKNGATRATWSMADACSEFGRTSVESLSFLDRCHLIGFKTRPSEDSHPQFPNHWGSLGNGSRWMLCEQSEKLIRYDCAPIQSFRLNGTQLVDCSTNEPQPAAIEQTPPEPQKTRPPARSIKSRLAEPIEHSGANVAQPLFA